MRGKWIKITQLRKNRIIYNTNYSDTIKSVIIAIATNWYRIMRQQIKFT